MALSQRELAVDNDTIMLWGMDPSVMFEAAGFTPDPMQREYLQCKDQRIISDITRQFGKSLTTATIGYNESICFPGSLTLVFCPAERQSKNVLNYAKDIHSKLGQPVPIIADTQVHLKFWNGSEFWALPGTEKTTRGFAALSLLILDEASRIENSLYKSVRPMLAVSGGRLAIASTPFGTDGFYADTWNGDVEGYDLNPGDGMRPAGLAKCERCGFDGELSFWETRRLCELCWLDEHFWQWRSNANDGWTRFRVLAEDCPRIPDWFLDEERNTLGPYWFRQEYCCQFLAGEESVFDPVALRKTLDPGVEALFDMPSPDFEDTDFRDPNVTRIIDV
jgi:hypothetical protein